MVQHSFTFFNMCIGNDTIAVCMHKRAFKDCLVADGKRCLKRSIDRGKLLFSTYFDCTVALCISECYISPKVYYKAALCRQMYLMRHTPQATPYSRLFRVLLCHQHKRAPTARAPYKSGVGALLVVSMKEHHVMFTVT